MATTGQRVKALRIKMGLTQKQLAEKAKMSQQGVWVIETDKTLKSGSLIAIAKVLGTTPHELLTGRPAPSDTLELNAEYLELFLSLAPKLLKERGLEPTNKLVAKVVATGYNFAIKALAGEELSSQAAQVSLFRALEDQMKS